MVKNALYSIKHSNFYYDNWKLLFVDDGSHKSGKKILYDILWEHKNKIEYINTNLTTEDKNKLGGSLIGKYANNELIKTDCDYAIMLCDDDALYPNYLYNLNKYFYNNPNQVYAYSHVIKFNPKTEMFWEGFDNEEDRIFLPFDLNHWIEPINPFQKLDASQICWNVKRTVDEGTLFTYPLTLNLDAWFYKKLYENFGECKYTGFISQFKGDYDDPLSQRQWNPDMYELRDS